MSLVRELNNKNNNDYGYGNIKFNDLVIGQKYKVYALTVYDSTTNNKNRRCLRIDFENGYFTLHERDGRKLPNVDSSNVKNLYVTCLDRYQGNCLSIRFSEGN